MENKKNLIIGLVVVVLILVVVGISFNKKTSEVKGFTVGAVLPLTGPAATWGENAKNGMELALEDKPDLKVLYEDSKGVPADGISAFDRLQLENPNITVTVLSAVSAALSKTALDRKVPLLATMTTADGIANDYTVRYFNNALIYSEPAFTSPISPVIGSKKIALLYRNDDLGSSVLKQVQELSAKYNKDLVFSEAFKPNESDYLTVLTKVKASGAEVLLFTDATPVEGVSILKMSKQLRFTIPIIETSSVFSDLGNRKQVSGIQFYSTAFDFVSPDKAVDFKAKYLAKYGKEPNFGAAFGYDTVNFIYKCKDRKDSVLQCLRDVNQIVGVSGTANQVALGDFVVTMHLEKVN
jgi:branched-chain amino acid transport system substrate-binding protein